MFKDPATVATNLSIAVKMMKERKRNNMPPAPERASSKSRSPPACQTREVGELSVICLSACRDGQLAHDNREWADVHKVFHECYDGKAQYHLDRAPQCTQMGGPMTLIFAHATDATYQRIHFRNSDKLQRSISAGP